MRANLQFPLVTILVGLSLLSANLFAKSADREKPRLKEFGSSLKRLKWDPQQKETGETKPQSRNPADDDVITIDTTLVACDLLVVDKQGRTVHGLKAGDFAITEDGTPQQVGHFLLGDNAKVPRSIVLIIDYSGSQFPYIKNSVDAAKLLVAKLEPLDRMAIVTDDVEMLFDFTNNNAELRSKLD